MLSGSALASYHPKLTTDSYYIATYARHTLAQLWNWTQQKTKTQAWDASDLCKVIVIKGAGEKAFCAGGDVRQVVELANAGKQNEALEFFAEEYKLNHMIATLQTPFVAILDGITSKDHLVIIILQGVRNFYWNLSDMFISCFDLIYSSGRWSWSLCPRTFQDRH